MGVYTISLEGKIQELYPEDDDYLEKLEEIVRSFRSFDQALDSFLSEHGYTGDLSDLEEKTAFIRGKYRERGISAIPRNLKKWFTEQKRMEKETAFSFCYAFDLTTDETEDFLRRILLERGFDHHQIRDSIYYFGFRTGLSWAQIQDLLERAPKPRIRTIDLEEVEYTNAILEDVRKIQDPEKLLQFFQENLDAYTYNNAAAMKNIRHLWQVIASEDGLANQEGLSGFYSYHEENEEQEERERREKREKTFHQSRSVWHVFLQILGFTQNMEQNLHSDRSLKPILKDNRLLHPLAEDSFPDKQGLEMALRGEHTSNERIRKLLILLDFYSFWMKSAIRSGKRGMEYQAKGGDADRFFVEVNRYLMESGYHELYAGNPYDWLFLFLAEMEEPLSVFREFIHHAYLLKEDQLISNKENQWTNESR